MSPLPKPAGKKKPKCQGQNAKEGRQGKRWKRNLLFYLEGGEERISRSGVKERATEGKEKAKPGRDRAETRRTAVSLLPWQFLIAYFLFKEKIEITFWIDGFNDGV